MQLEFEDGINLLVAEAQGVSTAHGFDFRSSLEAILAAIELYTLDFARLAILGDGGVFFAEIFEQIFFGIGATGRTADDADDVIEVIQGDLVAEQNVFALFSLLELEDGARANAVVAMFNEELDERDQPQFTRLPTDDGKQDHAEGFLHLRVFEKIVEDELRFFAALQFDDNAHAFARGFIAYIGNTFQFFRLDKFRDPFNEACLVDLIRNFGNDDAFAIFAVFFNSGFGPHGEAATSGLICRQNAFAPGDVGPRGEIRTGDQLHDFLERGVRLFDEENSGVNDLAEVVRRNVGGHADGDT